MFAKQIDTGAAALVLAASATVSLFLSGAAAEAVGAGPGLDDWPQVQRDERRTGWAPRVHRPPYRRLWVWVAERTFRTDDWTELPPVNTARLNRTCQVVAADGMCHFGSLNGRMYGVEIATGETKWSFQTGGPILHAAGVAGGRVYFGSADGHIYAVDARSGRRVWSHRTGAAPMTAPCLVGGNVYMGGRDRVFRALDGRTGRVIWRREFEAPILCTAASDGERVFFGTEDGVARALDIRTGRELWSAQTNGGSMRHYWPVVGEKGVVFRSMVLTGHAEYCKSEGYLIKFDGKPWEEVQRGFAEFLEANADQETLFVYDRATGRKKFTAPVGFLSRHGDVPPPPVIGPDGKAYVWFRTTSSSMKRSGFGSKMSHDIGGLDLATGQIRSPAPPKSRASQFRNCTDDYCLISGAGNWLFGQHTRPIMMIPLAGEEKGFDFVGQWSKGLDGIFARKKLELATPDDRRPLVKFPGDQNLGRGYSAPTVCGPYVLYNNSGSLHAVCAWVAENRAGAERSR